MFSNLIICIYWRLATPINEKSHKRPMPQRRTVPYYIIASYCNKCSGLKKTSSSRCRTPTTYPLTGWSRIHTTPEGADPPEINSHKSYNSGRLKPVLAWDQPDPSEGATGPWPTCTWPPAPPAALEINQRLHREETPSVLCPSPSSRMTCGSTTLQTATVSEDWTT